MTSKRRPSLERVFFTGGKVASTILAVRDRQHEHHVKAPISGELTVVAHEVRRDGGMERAQFEVVAGLLERGWAVHLIARVCELPAHERLRWTRVRTPRRPFALAYPAFAAVASAVLARSRGQSIVTVLGAIVFNRVDVMTVQFCHHAFAAHPSRRAQRPSILRRVNDRVGSVMTLAMERWSLRPGRILHFAAVSSLVADEINRYFPAVAAVSVIPNGTDPDHFRPDADRRRRVRLDLGLADDELVALFVGGDWRRKGLGIAIDAAGRADWTLLVVGSGDPEQYAASIAASGASVQFLGVTHDPAAVFSSADAFLLPSSYEGFALVTIEAAASGLPLLVTQATGAADLASAGGGRLLPRERGAFAEALRELADDPALRDRMGRSARQAATALAWPDIVDRHEAVYSGMARSRQAISTPGDG
jgi:UDP-glucose:(heptosyl)LPS alpha-1,3-glucosyltransferase